MLLGVHRTPKMAERRQGNGSPTSVHWPVETDTHSRLHPAKGIAGEHCLYIPITLNAH